MKNWKLRKAAVYLSLIFFAFLLSKIEITFHGLDDLNKSAEKTDEFGFSLNSFDVFLKKVQKNQTFSDILFSGKIPGEKVAEIIREVSGVTDLRKMSVGSKFSFYKERERPEEVKYIVYEQDPVNALIINLNDTLNIIKHKKTVSVSPRIVHAVLSGSLYKTLSDKNVNPDVAVRLSELFGWQIDFYRLQEGDEFKIYFEEKIVNGRIIGSGKILAAEFIHCGKIFNAFLFNDTGKEDFFDSEGNSMRKAFLKAPLKFSRISSGFSYRRLHPVLKAYRPHTGVDYAAPAGTEVQAVGDGIVDYSGYKGAEGNYIKIKHPNEYMSGYMHLSRFASGMKKGRFVKQGEVIGYVGSTGRSTGPHLDFRFWKKGQPLDFLRTEFPSSFPLTEKNREAFFRLRDQLTEKMNAYSINKTTAGINGSNNLQKENL